MNTQETKFVAIDKQATPATNAAMRPSERNAKIAAALALVAQDYSPYCNATVREYVENAVAQLIDAGYSRELERSEQHERSEELERKHEQSEPCPDCYATTTYASGIDETEQHYCAKHAPPPIEQAGEAVAYCDPSDPRPERAFSWPGTARNPQHETPLYLRPQPEQPASAVEPDFWIDETTCNCESHARKLELAGNPETASWLDEAGMTTPLWKRPPQSPAVSPPSVVAVSDELNSLREHAEASDVCNYGTLSTTFVREHCDRIEAALRTPRPESDARDAARMQAIAAHPGWLRYLSSGNRKGKWAFHAPVTNYEYDVFDTPQAAIDAALIQPEATR